MRNYSANCDAVATAQAGHTLKPDDLPDELRSLLDHVGRLLAEEYVKLVDQPDDANQSDAPDDQGKLK